MSSTIISSVSLVERLGIGFVVAGALLLSTKLTPALAAYLCLTIGTAGLLVAALRKSDSAQALLQLIFLLINTVGLTMALASHA